MTEKKGIRLQGRPRYEPPRVVRLGAAADGRGQFCGNGSSNEYACFDGASAGGNSCDSGGSPG